MKKRILSALIACSVIAGISIPAVNAVYVSDTSVSSVKSTEDEDMLYVCSLELRRLMRERETEITVNVPAHLFTAENIDKIISDAFDIDEKCTAKDGDYLRWTTLAVGFSCNTGASDGAYSVVFTPIYRTTSEQEEEVDGKIAKILDTLNIYSGSEYEKIKAVYEYVAQNVEYKYSNIDSLSYSAYGAVVQGEAVCQGYALLTYRLLQELNVNVRIIPGTANGGPHMWNIAEINGKYYYLDVTFDSTIASSLGKYKPFYFLKGTSDFDSAMPDSEPHVFSVNVESPIYYDYMGDDFLARFNISDTAYNPEEEQNTTTKTTITTTTLPETDILSGDANCDGVVNIADATAIVQFIANTDKYPLSETGAKNADVDGVAGISGLDALLLQQVEAGTAELPVYTGTETTAE